MRSGGFDFLFFSVFSLTVPLHPSHTYTQRKEKAVPRSPLLALTYTLRSLYKHTQALFARSLARARKVGVFCSAVAVHRLIDFWPKAAVARTILPNLNPHNANGRNGGDNIAAVFAVLMSFVVTADQQ